MFVSCDWYNSIYCVSHFQGSLAVAIVMIDSSDYPTVSWVLNFKVRVFMKSSVRLEVKHCHKRFCLSLYLCQNCV